MASITVRNLDDEVKTHLRVRAAEHHHSMEDVRIGIALVTRNVRDFEDIEVVDPWEAA